MLLYISSVLLRVRVVIAQSLDMCACTRY